MPPYRYSAVFCNPPEIDRLLKYDPPPADGARRMETWPLERCVDARPHALDGRQKGFDQKVKATDERIIWPPPSPRDPSISSIADS
jgi:hypothetical protein